MSVIGHHEENTFLFENFRIFSKYKNHRMVPVRFSGTISFYVMAAPEILIYLRSVQLRQ